MYLGYSGKVMEIFILHCSNQWPHTHTHTHTHTDFSKERTANVSHLKAKYLKLVGPKVKASKAKTWNDKCGCKYILGMDGVDSGDWSTHAWPSWVNAAHCSPFGMQDQCCQPFVVLHCFFFFFYKNSEIYISKRNIPILKCLHNFTKNTIEPSKTLYRPNSTHGVVVCDFYSK